MKALFALALILAAPSAFAAQALQDAMRMNPKIAAAVMATKAAAGVDCILTNNPMQVKARGPQGRPAVSLQSACYDPMAFNPSQLGQMIVTYYGDGRQPNSPVGDLVDVQFTIWK